MPAEKSLNKLRVTKMKGTDSTVGLMTPQVHMLVNDGIDSRYIKSLDSDNGQVTLAKTDNGTAVGKAYPHELAISYPDATGLFNFPNNSTDVVFGHTVAIPISTTRRSYSSNGVSVPSGINY